MRYHILAADYDGTVARNGKVSFDVVEALKSLKASGRKLMLVTGRKLDELREIFPDHALFDRIVAENGAVIYRPATLEERLLGEPPPESFIKELKDRDVKPLSVGRVIVATWEPHQSDVLEAIKSAGIEYQVIFNKGAVMILPPGINKAKGLETALEELNFSMHNVVAIGDAENDSAMLLAAECSVAVANALNPVKDIANWVTPGDHGTGVVELIKRLLENDLYDLDKKLKRHYLELGIRSDTSVFKISPYRSGILLTGTSGAGKTTFTIAFLESLIAQQYQFCLVDPEGDYLDLPEIATLGDTEHAPAIEQIIKLLENPLQSVVICLLAIPMDDRPAFLKKLLAAVLELRTSSGHPHWLILDEAHHLIPSEEPSSLFNISADFNNFMLITTGPDLLNRSVLEKTGMIIAIGEKPGEAFRKYAEICKLQPPEVALSGLQKGEALVWENAAGTAPFLIRSAAPRHLTQRHKRKYSKGDMGPDSFYFKGPEGKLNLKAQNLMAFIQIAEGLDDETWMYHLKRKDYSKWFRHFVNDNELAAFTEKIEGKENDPEASRKNIRKLIEEKYTGPAE